MLIKQHVHHFAYYSMSYLICDAIQLRFKLCAFMTTLAGGFLVTNYHDGGYKVSKSSLDRGRRQKRSLRQTAVDAWRG